MNDIAFDKLNKYIRFRLKLLRRLKGISQFDLAEACGISSRNYQRIERGETTLKLDTLVKLCEILDSPISSFFIEHTSEEFSDFYQIKSVTEAFENSTFFSYFPKYKPLLIEFYNHDWNDEVFFKESETTYKDLALAYLDDKQVHQNLALKRLSDVNYDKTSFEIFFKNQKDTDLFWYYIFINQANLFYFDTVINYHTHEKSFRCFVKVQNDDELNFEVITAVFPKDLF